MRQFFYTLFLIFSLGLISGAARSFGDSPFNPEDSDFTKWAPVLVDDALMPRPAEVAAVHDWIRNTFGGESHSEIPADSVSIVVERQDYNLLRFNETCVENPFEIGSETFEKGLGTHANSRLIIRFPEPVTSFSAKAGLYKRIKQCSVEYAVEVAGKELIRTPTLHGGDEPFSIDVEFDPPVTEFVLITDATEDGPSCDQANWLDPVAGTADGKIYDLVNDGFISRLRPELPFSFKYNGVSSREFLSNWTFHAENVDETHTVYSWTDPETKLTVSATVRSFKKFAAVDWVLNFQNNGTENYGRIEDVQVLDAGFDLGYDNTAIAIHTLTGDFCNENSWLPKVELVEKGNTRLFAPVGGRSSNGSFPFWNLTQKRLGDDEPAEGVFIALGWSGQWNAEFENVNAIKSQTRVSAGMEKISTILYPGEKIRSPRILLMPWKTDRLSSHALFRRLLMFEYIPKLNNRPLEMETIGQCFDRYYRKRPGWEKYDGQVEFAKRLKEAGCTTYWFDAAWFPVGFPNGVGNWYSDKENFPNGLEQLGQVIKDLGMKFVLWFEPERVAANTEIATKYPQYVFGGEKGGLYKLNDPEARNFLTGLLLRRIREYQVSIYRNDFNIDPLPFWRDNDPEDRQGMTEIRYVEGHYEMWNRFRSEIPGLWIDNCASGGRRIDLETISISVPLWRSDTCCWPNHPEWDQCQSIGIAQYLPLFSSVAWDASPYTFRSAANPGCILQYNFLDDDYDPVSTKQSVDEARTYRKFWYGDFYPLSDAIPGIKSVIAWQLHRADLNAGLVYIFRQSESRYPGIYINLRGIDPDAVYQVNVKMGYEVTESKELAGKELRNYLFLMKENRTACVIEYIRK